MKFLLVTGIYAEAARKLREGCRAGLEHYESIYRLYSDAAFAGSDRYAIHLAESGWEAAAVFANDKVIQRKWADERGLPVTGRAWRLDVLCHQIQEHQSEVVFLLDLFRFDRAAREEIRARCPSVRWILGWRAAPLRENEDFSDLDLFLSSLKSLVQEMRSNGLRAERLGAGFDSLVLDRVNTTKRDLPVTFLGSIGGGDGFHSRRRAILSEAFSLTPLKVWSDSADELAAGKSGLFSKLLRKRRIFPGVYGIEMYRIMARSLLSLNVHIDMAGTEAVNLRLFEATGVGACLITDNPDTVGEFFEVDRELVGFSSADELVEKISYLLRHPGEAAAIAAAGRSRTLREHTLRHRTHDLMEILRREFSIH